MELFDRNVFEKIRTGLIKVRATLDHMSSIGRAIGEKADLDEFEKVLYKLSEKLDFFSEQDVKEFQVRLDEIVFQLTEYIAAEGISSDLFIKRIPEILVKLRGFTLYFNGKVAINS